MSFGKRFGPYGPDGAYVWVELAALEEARARQLDKPRFPQIRVRPNIAYASPVTGQAVTTWRGRQYDLERAGCVDAREGAAMAEDARRGRSDPLAGLTLAEVEGGA